jgi:hypothetical protein
VFGATTDTFISRVYKTTVEVLDDKADGLLHGNRLQHWVPIFGEFVGAIRCKLHRPQYGELLSEVSHRVLLRGFFFLRIFLRPGIMFVSLFVCLYVYPTF